MYGGVPQLLLLDIDGCLNPENGAEYPPGARAAELKPEHRDILAAIGASIAECGVRHVVLNSGRGLNDTLYIATAAAWPALGHLLLEHGARGWDVRAGRPLDVAALAGETGDQALVALYADEAPIRAALAWHASAGAAVLARHYGAPVHCFPKEVNLSLTVPDGETAEGLLAFLHAELERGLGPALASRLHSCHSTRYVDVLGGPRKSDGARLLCRLLGIAPADTLVMGDGQNDLDLFEAFPRLLAPANSHPEILRLCRERGGTISDKRYGPALVSFLRGLRR